MPASSAAPDPSTPAAPVHTPWGVTTAAVTPGRRSAWTQRSISFCIAAPLTAGNADGDGAGHGDADATGFVPAAVPLGSGVTVCGPAVVQAATVTGTESSTSARRQFEARGFRAGSGA